VAFCNFDNFIAALLAELIGEHSKVAIQVGLKAGQESEQGSEPFCVGPV
jgi:hypothetical protein